MRNRYTQRPTQYIGDVYRLFSTHLRVDRLVCAISLSILDFQRIKKERRKKSPSRRIICCCHINGLLLLLSFSPPNFSFLFLGLFFYKIPACSWISRQYRAAAAVSSVIITGLHLIIMWGKKEERGRRPLLPIHAGISFSTGHGFIRDWERRRRRRKKSAIKRSARQTRTHHLV